MTMPIKLDPPPRGSARPQRTGEPSSQICRVCPRLLTICSFAVRTNGRRQTICRQCQSERGKGYYQADAATVKARSKKSSPVLARRNRQWLISFLADKRCHDCNEACADIMEFDHRRGVKRATVSKMVQRGDSIAAIETEIAKCDLVCPCCHRLRTERDQRSYTWRHVNGVAFENVEAWVSPTGSEHEHRIRSQMRRAQRNQLDNIAYLEQHPCVDCSQANIILLEHDHVRGTKVKELNKLISEGAPLAKVHAERAKCDVRCCNCHRRRSGNVRPLVDSNCSPDTGGPDIPATIQS